MESYKFDIKIDNNGIIQLPYFKDLVNREVEVIIVPKTQKSISRRKKGKGHSFVKIWSGFISERPNSKPRIDFIRDKYK